ncbi:Hypothetical protein PHPALM_17546 [Phytophthora palmivora]|uniref:Uncharacterized protein n=1 Tax=Phytophthora palmivora TaxID=4796 RepID=A0A2P4XM22_9STRA|nr:Hypothetical protein PHPALM_17546 [Phytophthora palmivora]
MLPTCPRCMRLRQELCRDVTLKRTTCPSTLSEHLANDIELTDYAQELAFLPDLTEITVTALDYTGRNVQNKDLDVGQQQKLVDVLKRHEKIVMSSGNALPPPIYGVVCDIDVQGHAPIKQRDRRTPLRFLVKLYELLKGLLRAGLITFSDSPWASPIVIVLKKNGIDIRLCIDYKMVNAVTAIMEYAMPLVDELLTDMEAYLWFYSLDAVSGFWAAMMTQRARKISAFVCALGHFEWLRMPFGLKNAPMIYQRMIDNALWGFVQPKGGWSQFTKAMRGAEEQTMDARTVATEDSNQHSEASPRARTKFEADRESSTVMNAVSLLVNSPTGDMFANGESDESSLVPVFDRRSFVDDICFGNETLDGCLATLDRLLQRFTECRISVCFTKSVFVQAKVDFLSHEVSSEDIRADPKKIKAVTEVPFPNIKESAALYQLKDTDFEPEGDLTVAKRSFAALQQKEMDAPILRHFDRDKAVHVMLFANEWALSSTLIQEYDGRLHPVQFCGRVLKDAEMNYHPAEKEVLALLLLLKVCYTELAGRTIQVYTRFWTLDWVHKSKTLFGRTTQFAVMLSPWHLVVQRMKERDCLFAQLLQAGLTSFVDLDDSLAQVAPPTKGSTSIRMDPNLLYARLPRSYQGLVLSFDGSAKTEKHGAYGSCAWILWRLPEWTIVTAASAYLEATTVNLAEYAGMNNGVQAALEHTTEDFVIVGDSRLAIQQSLGVIACLKESLLTQLNRHREPTAKFRSVKYLHVVREFNAAANSLARETLESKVPKVEPTAKAETEDKPSINTDRVVPTGFVVGKAMADTTALCVAKAFEECVYRRFGAPTMIRHDRDPRFMSEVFQAFAEMMQSRSRATLSYRPQVGQQERSVKTVMQSVRVYAEDPLQQDWDEIAEKLIFAINNSMDATRKETPFYLVHGAADDTPVTAPRPLFEPGNRVWLYMKRVKPGLTKTLAHRWHGPFRVKRKVEEFAYELELPDLSGYRFYPVVHVSRLKAVNELGSQVKSRLAPEVTEETRLDFGEELLPEDSWEPDQLAGEYEVDAILDDRVPLSTSTDRAVREFEVKWLGYDEPTWEPASNLSCGGLLYDYLREKRIDRRLQKVQVADED